MFGSIIVNWVAIQNYSVTPGVSELIEGLVDLLPFDDFGCVGLFGANLLLNQVSVSLISRISCE
jgi:hypothetical protein